MDHRDRTIKGVDYYRLLQNEVKKTENSSQEMQNVWLYSAKGVISTKTNEIAGHFRS